MDVRLLIVCYLIWATANASASRQDWENFKKKYDKKYVDATEEQKRLDVYLQNKEYIESHNAKAKLGQYNFTLAMNRFGDMTSHEYSAMLLEEGPLPYRPKKFLDAQVTDVPDSFDWRTMGLVTEVKDQFDCSCSWAFSAAGALEALLTDGVLSLSAQNLLDCSIKYGTLGCQRGLPYQAFQYVIANGGIDTDLYYPYIAQVGLCLYSPDPLFVGATCTGYVDVMIGDENDLKSSCGSHGPISAVIDASLDSFRFYDSGVYYDSECNPDKLNQAVLVVGYGTDQGDYWIIKNSWGVGWGDAGYILMARNQGNLCGIATEASYPTIII